MRDLMDLILLAALWGASFLFLRIAVPHFGAVPLIELRVAIGGLVLLPLLALRRGLPDLSAAIRPIFIVGVVNSALPFTLFAYATISLNAGFVSILNASAPLFGAIVAWFWLKDRLSPLRIVGLLIGFTGVVVLVWGKASFEAGGSGPAILASLLASLLYGTMVNYTKQRLAGVNSLAIACGSQLCAAVALLPLAIWWWPAELPDLRIWLSVIALGVGCTGIAFILYFRLIANAGPAKAIAVTFLIPVFGMLWGALFLDEETTIKMLAGCATILLGTALTTGIIARKPLSTLAQKPASSSITQ
jgi:drug/metabolite transporter (DMT)-like permease